MNTTLVTVGCRLPRGFTIETGTPGTEEYAFYNLNGRNNSVQGRPYGVTKIPSDVWASWLGKNKGMRYVMDRSIFLVPGSM